MKPTIPMKLKRNRSISDLETELKLVRPQVYGLLYPEKYIIPAAIFDARSPLAARVAAIAKVSIRSVVGYYLESHRQKQSPPTS